MNSSQFSPCFKSLHVAAPLFAHLLYVMAFWIHGAQPSFKNIWSTFICEDVMLCFQFSHLWYGIHAVVTLHQFIFGGHAVLSFPHSCKKQQTESKQPWVRTTLPRVTQAVKNLPLVVSSSLYREIIIHSANLHMKVVPKHYSIFQHFKIKLQRELQHSVSTPKGDIASTAVIFLSSKRHALNQ